MTRRVVFQDDPLTDFLQAPKGPTCVDLLQALEQAREARREAFEKSLSQNWQVLTYQMNEQDRRYAP